VAAVAVIFIAVPLKGAKQFLMLEVLWRERLVQACESWVVSGDDGVFLG
jgi:hypothetical protein